MAHPNKKDSAAAHTDKMRRMTQDYGSAAGPDENIPAESDSLKQEGDEDSVGFGSDSSAPSARRGDRARRGTAAANPVSTYRKGGRVKSKKRADGGDVSSIETANRDQAMATPRARGGRTKAKGTHVNVIVAPQGGGAGAPMPPPVLPVGGPPPMAGMPPKPPMMPPGGAPPMGGAMPPPGLLGAPGAPGGMPPGIMPPRATGGRVTHADEAQDKELIMTILKDEGLTRSDSEVKRARGGKINSIHDMDAGSMSGPGRIEKAELQKNAGRKAPQEV